ncbi:MAG: DUF922 domain-containing protein [Bacteroidia bacterium]
MSTSFLLSFILTLCSFQQGKDIIAWQENVPLTWDDFNGKPEPRFAAASTSYDILKQVNKKNEKLTLVKIEAVFFKNKSWKKKNWINDEVLAHEQKHFDIVELFARKLRKKLSETKFKNHNEIEIKFQELYDINDSEMDKYQDKYDEETDGSMNGDQQRAWQKKIAKEIKELDDFKSTVIKISF